MINPMDLSERIVLVTGASSGLGRETSILLSQLGAQVILVGRREEQLNKTVSMMTGTRHRVEAYDLTAIDEIPRWLKKIAGETGPLHGSVHCAGVQVTLSIRVLGEKRLHETMNINFSAAVGLARAFRQKGVVSPEGGSIVFLTSVAGLAGQAGQVAYCGSKGALIATCRALALELAPERIRVNCVAPGFIKTEMGERAERVLTPEQFSVLENAHPLGLGSPRDVANAVAFLLADESRWITGTTFVVDGGFMAA